MIKKLLPILATLLLVACGGTETSSTPVPATTETPTLYFSAIPDKNKENLRAKFDAVATYLSEQLDVPVVYKPTTDYGASVQEFINGNIHFAWFGGLTGVQAMHKVGGARAIIQGKADPNFYSYFIARKDSGIEPAETFPNAIAQRSFCFGSPRSTSGRLMPEYFIKQETDKSPTEFFGKEPAFSGNHEATYTWVKSGKIDCGVLNYKVYESMAAADNDGEVIVIWKTPTYADYNLTAHPDLETLFGAGFTDRLQQVLLDLDEKAPEILAAFQREELIPATNEDFDIIRQVATDLGFLN